MASCPTSRRRKLSCAGENRFDMALRVPRSSPSARCRRASPSVLAVPPSLDPLVAPTAGSIASHSAPQASAGLKSSQVWIAAGALAYRSSPCGPSSALSSVCGRRPSPKCRASCIARSSTTARCSPRPPGLAGEQAASSSLSCRPPLTEGEVRLPGSRRLRSLSLEYTSSHRPAVSSVMEARSLAEVVASAALSLKAPSTCRSSSAIMLDTPSSSRCAPCATKGVASCPSCWWLSSMAVMAEARIAWVPAEILPCKRPSEPRTPRREGRRSAEVSRECT
mmetsp:Transcript_16471/g.45936  ORF Transcript_16471/g.45936 Transcript_16471/m.45936 type:complete len:279 (+) Transcript_16471:8348-9184(+)